MSIRLNTSIDLNQIKHVWKGVWDEGVVYYLNDVVKYNGQSFVCVTTELSDQFKYGKIYRPTVANEYWKPFSNGYLIRGDWSYKDYYYPGDVIRYNDDWYLCNTYNFAGHPIYENGSLTSKWTLLTRGSKDNRCDNFVWFAGYNPIGWTLNMTETPDQFWRQDAEAFTVINGNYEPVYYGRGTSGYGFGSESVLSEFTCQSNMGFDFWDYYDGYRSSITGGMPKCIQIVGGWYHKLFLFDNGEVYSYGYGGRGQNGDGTTTSYNFSRRVGRSTEGRGGGILRDVFIIKIAAAGGIGIDYMSDYENCAALDIDGNLWTWGYAGYGSLGHGNNTNLNVPTKIDKRYFNNAKIIDVWCVGSGSYQSMFALDENHQLWGWGYNAYGSLGIGDINVAGSAGFDANSRPVKLPLDFSKYGGVKKFLPQGASTAKLNVLMTNDDQLWWWGYSDNASGWGINFGGPAGTNRVVNQPTPVKKLIYENSKSLGMNITPKIGTLIDVVDNCEDFWIDSVGGGDVGTAMILKEKNTGLLYGLGRSYDASLAFKTGSDNPYGASDDSITNVADYAVVPIPMSIGNFNDVKYMVRIGAVSSDGRSYVFVNSDGRVVVTGSYYDDAILGVAAVNGSATGSSYAFSEETSFGLANNIMLPWEYDITYGASTSPVQVRFPERISMITPHSAGGWLGITKNNKLVYTGLSGGYSIFPTDSGSNTVYSLVKLVI